MASIFSGDIRFISASKTTAIVKQSVFGASSPTYELVYVRGDFSSKSKGSIIKYQYAANADYSNTISFVA